MKKQNNESFPLEQTWLLEKGAINLYAISTTGVRKFIAHFSAPALLFPCNQIAVSEGVSELNEAEGDTPSDLWILALAKAFKEDVSPEGAITGEPGKVRWICVKEGQAKLFGLTELTLNPGEIFPLTRGIWLQVDENAQIEECPSGRLDSFNRLFSWYLTRLLGQEASAVDDRILHKKENDEAAIHEALLKMVNLINPTEEVSTIYSGDRLFNACQKIGHALKIPFIFPKGKDPATLEEICENSKIRYRQVSLKRNWWEEDAGHLLGFRGEEPLVLLNSSPGKYTLNHQTVTEEIARQILPTAYVFYQPLPDELKTGKALFRIFLARNKKEYFALGVYGSIAALLSLIPPFVTSNLYNAVLPNADLDLLYQLIVVMVAAGISATLFTFFRSLILVRMEGKIGHEVQTSIWDRLLKLPTIFFRRYSSGNLFSRIESLEEIRMMLSTGGARVTLAGIFSSFYFIAMAFYALRLAVVTFFLTAIVLLITFLACRVKIRLEKRLIALKPIINGVLIQIIGGIAKLRISGAEPSAFSYWAKLFGEQKALERRVQQIQNSITVVNAVLPFLSAAWIFQIAIEAEKKGLMTDWQFLAFDAAFIPFSMALYDLSNTLLSMTPILSLWNQAKIIVEEPLEITMEKIDPGKLQGEISIDQVNFHYLPDYPILKNISLKIAPGEFVGIVGPSGCGKSTLFRILLGFEKPVSGAVFYDGKDLSNLDPYKVRKQLGAVLQGSSVISGSLFENIVTGGVFTKKDVERAIQLSGFEQDLDSFPMGLHTVVISGGSSLSGGQKQRLLIARALISHPKILFFDEATSALDNKTQDTVSNNIDHLDVTRVVIAHRLSTLKHADRIYVLDKGTIAQQGSFDELAKEPGLFQEMLARQEL